jgi:inorganic phosphate transporter, PiT family
MTILLIAIIACALIFDYINGFHDAANSIATVVSTKVLTPLQAVVWAAFFNFVAFFIFQDHGVADTIAKTVHKDFITLPVVLSGLIAAIFWNLLTWWFGIPSSSSHTLIGGFAGAAIAHAGFGAINMDKYPTIMHTAAFILLAPLVGMIMALLISLWFIHSFSKSIWPKLVSLAVMAGVVFFISTVMVTSTTRVIGIKGEANEGKPGMLIKELAHNSPAMNMGMKKGDVLLQVDGNPVNSVKEVDAILLKHLYDDNISYAVHRKDEDKVIQTQYRTKFKNRAIQIALYGENFKWLLIGFIVISIGIFTLCLSSLNYSQSTKWFKRMQLVSSAAFSIGHGGNDAQKVMGIITAALIAGGQIGEFREMPGWVPLACYSAISLGTLSGGWKIIKTMGTRITKVTPFEGVAAETAGAITLFVTEQLKNYPYNHWLHYRGRCHEAPECGALGSNNQPPLGLDTYYSGKWSFGCRCVCCSASFCEIGGLSGQYII